MRNMKKFLALLLALTLCFSLIASAYAEEDGDVAAQSGQIAEDQPGTRDGDGNGEGGDPEDPDSPEEVTAGIWGVEAVSITDTSATLAVTYTVDGLADDTCQLKVYYSTEEVWDEYLVPESVAATAAADSAEEQTASLTINGLSPETEYFYSVCLLDNDGNELAADNTRSFVTLPLSVTNSVSSAVKLIVQDGTPVPSVTDTTAEITFSYVVDPADTPYGECRLMLFYSTNPNLRDDLDHAQHAPLVVPSVPEEDDPVPMLTLTGLRPGTTYYFFAQMSDTATTNTLAVEEETHSFDTSGVAAPELELDVPSPVPEGMTSFSFIPQTDGVYAVTANRTGGSAQVFDNGVLISEEFDFIGEPIGLRTAFPAEAGREYTVTAQSGSNTDMTVTIRTAGSVASEIGLTGYVPSRASRALMFTAPQAGDYYFTAIGTLGSLALARSTDTSWTVCNARTATLSLNGGEKVFLKWDGKPVVSIKYSVRSSMGSALAMLQQVDTQGDIRAQVQDIYLNGTEDIQLAMRSDDEDMISILNSLEALAAGTDPADGNPTEIIIDQTQQDDFQNVTVLGASLNDTMDGGPARLVIADPQVQYPMPEGYDQYKSMQFSMTLENVADPSALVFPVVVDFMLPERIDEDMITLFHYHRIQTGPDPEDVRVEIETVTPDVVYHSDEGRFYAKLLLDSFSDFTLAYMEYGDIMYEGAANISANSISLDGLIGVNFYVNIESKYHLDKDSFGEGDLEEGEVELPLHAVVGDTRIENFGKEEYWSDWYEDENGVGWNIYRLSGYVAAAEMDKPVTLRIFYDGADETPFPLYKDGVDYTQNGYSFSVRDYCALAEQQLDPEEYGSLLDLLNVMSEYGKYAQQYFNYNASGLVFDPEIIAGMARVMIEEEGGEYDDGDIPLGEDCIYRVVINPGEYEEEDFPECGITYNNSSLTLNAGTRVSHYFTIQEGFSLDDFRFEVIMENSNWWEEEHTDWHVEGLSGNRCRVVIDGIAAAELYKRHSVAVYQRGETDTEEDFEGAHIMNLEGYSALAYVRKALELENQLPANLISLMRCLALYNRAACNYFG